MRVLPVLWSLLLVAIHAQGTLVTSEAQGTPPRQHYKVIVTDGGCGGFEAWPDVKRLDNGDLLVAF
ncbi:MAG: hypothetical protein NTY99_03805, partial [DPANN group archaeon]|nr:hypothetical protein [DPANN group archaeon]